MLIMELIDGFDSLIYLLGTIAGIIAFWYNLKKKVDILSSEVQAMEKAVEELRVSRMYTEVHSKEEASSLRHKIEDLDKVLIKLSTQMEVQNRHMEIMLDLLIKRIERIERV